ncbi:MAG TPA: hypothetical protein VFR20_00015 [Burkholderiaceae bacterium]|nr:hypothetical protein [Burkholderiaceae bacterium]
MMRPDLLAGLYRWADAAKPEPAPNPCTSEQVSRLTKVSIPTTTAVLRKVEVPASPMGLRKAAHTPAPANMGKPDADALAPVATQVATVSVVSTAEVTKLVTTEKAVRSTVRTATAPRPNNPKLRDITEPVSDADQRLVDMSVRRFAGKGIPMLKARKLAERLLRALREDDDRRSCAECESFRAGRCVQGRQPFGGGGIEVLHRCTGFRLDGGNHD